MVEGRAQLSQAEEECNSTQQRVRWHLPNLTLYSTMAKLASAQVREWREGKRKNRETLEPKLAHVEA